MLLCARAVLVLKEATISEHARILQKSLRVCPDLVETIRVIKPKARHQ